jgi:hypothetical protein
MADEQTIRVKRPDGRYSRIPISSLKAAVTKGYTYAPSVSKPAAPESLTREAPILDRALDVIGQSAESTAGLPQRLTESSRQKFSEAKSKGSYTGMATAPFRAEGDEVINLLKGLWQSTAPGMIGQPPENKIANAVMLMAGAGEGGEPVRGLEEAAAKPLIEAGKKGLETPTRIALQRLAGAGKEPVKEAAIRREATVAERTAKAAEAQRDWVNRAMEARQQQAEAARVQARREVLERGQEAYADRLLKNIKNTYATVKGRLDSRWNSLRSTSITRNGVPTALRDEPLNSRAIADTIDIAERKFLQGAPDSLKQFRDLMNWMREDEGMTQLVGEEGGGAKAKLRPITWDEARTHYTALGDRMFSGDLPGNVMNAIRYVREKGLGEELKAGAGRFKALPQYESLLNDWSQFESDWKDTSSVTRAGGSPLAIAVKAPSGATLSPQVLGKTGDLLMQRLGKYTDAGASPATAAALRKLNAESKALPKVRAPEFPARPKPVEMPPEIDPIAIRRMRLLQYASRPKRWYDIVVPPHAVVEPLLSSDAIREWVARQPRKELIP